MVAHHVQPIGNSMCLFPIQANGRAEVAGRVLQDVLRKILIDHDINWVEALPRALRILHDTPDAINDLSPYEIVFGRQRALAGLPWSPIRECGEAHDFFDRMQEIDRVVAAALNDAHAREAASVNARRRSRLSLTVSSTGLSANPLLSRSVLKGSHRLPGLVPRTCLELIGVYVELHPLGGP